MKTFLALALVLCHVSLQAQKPAPAPAPSAEKPGATKAAAKAGNQIQMPDLRIMAVKVETKKMTVTVKNQCKGNVPWYRLELDIYNGATKASGVRSEIGTDQPPLKGGATVDAVIDLTNDASFGTFVGKFYVLRVDPKNKIKEAVESNNTFQTSGAGAFPEGANSCEPK